MTKKIIKQIGAEGRTTIPFIMRKAMRLKDGAFISFTYDPDEKNVTIRQEWFCDGCESDEDEVDPELLLILLGLDKELQEKATFVLKNMLLGLANEGRKET